MQAEQCSADASDSLLGVQVTDRGLGKLTADMTSLDIAGCVAITERGIARLAANMPNLAVLKVSAAQLRSATLRWPLSPQRAASFVVTLPTAPV